MSLANISRKTKAVANARTVPGEAAIWVFIIGDLLMFTAFFGQFLYDRANGQIEIFHESQNELSISFAAINTILLLTGSLFVVKGSHAFRSTAGDVAARYFLLAFAAAAAFGVNKVVEYTGKINSGIGIHTNDFYMYYFMYTGMHCLHLVIGMFFLARMWKLARAEDYSEESTRFIGIGGSYWHLVDLLWVVLFPLFYIVN